VATVYEKKNKMQIINVVKGFDSYEEESTKMLVMSGEISI